MANKERNKRSARKARSQERALREEQAVDAAANAKPAKAVAKKQTTKAVAKPKRRSRILGYFSDVRAEMSRVSWPSKPELKSYSVAVIALLVVFGVVVWAIDTIITGGIAGITGLRP